MSLLRFDIIDGEDQANRPDGSTFDWTVYINGLKPLVRKRIGKTTIALSGNAGETRIKGKIVTDTIVIPQITEAELPIALDFAAAMMYGFANPFYMDATDAFGIHRPFWGAVIDNDITPIENETCKEWSMSIPFREVGAPV